MTYPANGFSSLAMMLIGRIIAGFAIGLLSMSGKFPASPSLHSSLQVPQSPSTSPSVPAPRTVVSSLVSPSR